MQSMIRVKDRFYILADSSLADQQTNRVLKHGDTFAIFDAHGEIRPFGFENQGIFHRDTRFLSRSRLLFNGMPPVLLSSGTRSDNAFLRVHLTNPDFRDKQKFVPRGTVHMVRTIFLLEGGCFERFRVSNYGSRTLPFTLSWEFEADYADIFELRGLKRGQRGSVLPDYVEGGSITFAYRGLDRVMRRTRVLFEPPPRCIAARQAEYRLRLRPRTSSEVHLSTSCTVDAQPAPRLTFDRALALRKNGAHAPPLSACRIETSNRIFNKWLERSRADLQMLATHTEEGPYPFAGIPWFSTVFGRDGILTSLETLWADPSMARGVLGFLASTQADRKEPSQDAEPGKILHELRKGEMAATGEIPFGRYYGSVDATPLFVALAARYYERTGDLEFVRRLWPNIERALSWMDGDGDPDRDGFIEYDAASREGLRNQGWKDSGDSVFHADGRLARSPVALCEVQAYVYDAKLGAARLAEALGEPERAAGLQDQALRLRKAFIRAFWSEKISSYVIALDGKKRPCEVRSSNAAHCLFTGIAHTDHARRIASWLMDGSSFSGWGIRTLPLSEARYNPMSYHNGSVWPHDNAIASAGLARYGFKRHSASILSGFFDASTFFEMYRLPELFCGFHRDSEEPTLYPVACDPQAWAAGAVYMLLQACLGLSVRADIHSVSFRHPFMPRFLEKIHIRDLDVGGGRLDLTLSSSKKGVSLQVDSNKAGIDVDLVK